MAVTWTRVWCVGADGQQLFEYEASGPTPGDVIIRTRPVGGKGLKGSQRWSRSSFEHTFADSPVAAIEKFVTRQRGEIGNHQARIQVCELLLSRVEILRKRVIN